MFLAMELQTSGVYVSIHLIGLFSPSERVICTRKIALHGENVIFWRAKAPQQSHLGLLHGQRGLVH